MKPILYPEWEQTFDTNGIGILTDTISCYVERELNGIYELTMQYPISGIHYEDICTRSILLCTVDPVSEPQPFRVYKVVKTSKSLVTVYAQHIAYDCQGITCGAFSAPSLPTALNAMKGAATTECPFDFETDRSTAVAFANGTPKAIWDILGGSAGSLLDVYGGEWDFDRFTIRLGNRLGADRGVTIRYGKNLQSLEQEESIASTWTGVHPYWMGQDGTLVTLPEEILLADGNFSHTRIKPLDLSEKWTEAPTVEQLRETAQSYMDANDIGKPKVSIKVSFVPLEQTVEYQHLQLLERVLLGDTVTVVFPLLQVDATARVVSVRWNPLTDRYDWVQIGSVKSNLADTIARQEQEITNIPTVSLTEQIAQRLAQAFLGVSGGSARLLDTDGDGQPDELYIADNPDPNLAVRVWRWNCNGWAASSTGYNGPFEFGATLEDGILANAITAVQVTAGFLRSANGDIFIDLDNGVFQVGALSDYAKYFHFSVDGLIIGEADSPAQIILDNDEMRITVNGVDVIRFDSLGRGYVNTLYITGALNLLGIHISEDSTHINAEYLGGETEEAAAAVSEAQILPLAAGDGLTRSGSFSASIDGGDYTLRVDWSVAPSASGGTFVPTLKMYLVQKPWCNIRIGARSNTAIIGGKTYNWQSPKVYNDSVNQTITTHLGTVTGDAISYGSVEVSVTFAIAATLSGTYYGSIQASDTIQAVDYTAPRITALQAGRCDSDGTPAARGDYVQVAFSAAISPMGNTNTAAYAIQYRPTTGGSYTTQILTAYAGQYTVSGGTAIIAASSAKSWEIIVQATDSHSTTARAVTIGAAAKLFSLLKNAGQIAGAALGKIAELSGAFEVAWVLRPHRGIGMPSYKVASPEEADAALAGAYAAIADQSVGYLCIITTTSIDVLGGGNWIVTLYRYTDQHGCAEAINYQTNPPTRLSRSLYNGAWGGWVERSV